MAKLSLSIVFKPMWNKSPECSTSITLYFYYWRTEEETCSGPSLNGVHVRTVILMWHKMSPSTQPVPTACSLLSGISEHTMLWPSYRFFLFLNLPVFVPVTSDFVWALSKVSVYSSVWNNDMMLCFRLWGSFSIAQNTSKNKETKSQLRPQLRPWLQLFCEFGRTWVACSDVTRKTDSGCDHTRRVSIGNKNNHGTSLWADCQVRKEKDNNQLPHRHFRGNESFWLGPLAKGAACSVLLLQSLKTQQCCF